ncbi:MAG: DUF927 domain-containing protein [Bacteroidales bacterium]|nr:DUF927 domain-containing protein [Bacteroidales bacterium]
MENLSKETILSIDFLNKLFSEQDPLAQAEALAQASQKAAELKCKTEFNQLVKTYQKQQKTAQVESPICTVENYTNFTDSPYDNMLCGSWIATDEGIYKPSEQYGRVLACYHPILPLERLKNIDTQTEQIRIAFRRRGSRTWSDIIVPKEVIANKSQIVKLAGLGVSVTSETAGLLVRYLSDVENLNDEYIPVKFSSSKVGWINDDLSQFLPYDSDITFDSASRFQQIFDSIGTHGSDKVWFDHVKELRKTGKKEVKFFLAASFASVLIKGIDALPFIIDLWGETEGGKTVTMMLACSVWADPGENRYIGDFESTDVALEARADMLNNLPVILDDTSKVSSKIRENFEGMVYDLCSGKGKSRSNKDLGMNRENRWCNCILTSGERPLAGYVNQGGALNRVLEVECPEHIYKNPQKTADLIKQNYGFAGKEFIQVVKNLGWEKIREIEHKYQEKLESDDKMQKQAISAAIILTADQIATDYLFQDGVYITVDEAKELLVDKSALSDNERAYRIIMDRVAMNEDRFSDDSRLPRWGVITGGYVIFIQSALNDICQDNKISKDSFLSWADRNGLLQTSDGRKTKLKKIGESTRRCYWIKQLPDDGTDEDGFIQIEESDDQDVPFD